MKPVPPVPRLGGPACAALFAAAFAVRVAATLVSGNFGDAGAYQLAARTLWQTGAYPLRADALFFRPPAYSAFLAAVTLGHPERVQAARVANAALGALVPLLLAALSARVFGSRRLALATGALAAVHPAFVLAASRLQTEPLYLVLLLAAAHLLLAASDRPSSNLALLSGVLLALAALTRSVGLAFVPFLLAPLRDGRYPFRARWHLAMSALLGFVLALAPWTARNALVFHEFLLVNDAAGYAFYGGNSDASLGLIDARNRAELSQAVDALERARAARVAALPDRVRRSPTLLSRALTESAIAERRANPRGTARLLAAKVLDWLRPFPDPRFWPRGVVWTVGVFTVALFGLAAVGLAVAARRGVVAFCLAFLAVSMSVHVALEVNWRYRSAAWDPILLLYAAPGAAALASRRAATTRVAS